MGNLSIGNMQPVNGYAHLYSEQSERYIKEMSQREIDEIICSVLERDIELRQKNKEILVNTRTLSQVHHDQINRDEADAYVRSGSMCLSGISVGLAVAGAFFPNAKPFLEVARNVSDATKGHYDQSTQSQVTNLKHFNQRQGSVVGEESQNLREVDQHIQRIFQSIDSIRSSRQQLGLSLISSSG